MASFERSIPSLFTIDYSGERLYWIDNSNAKMHSIFLNGRLAIQLFAFDYGNGAYPFYLTVIMKSCWNPESYTKVKDYLNMEIICTGLM